MPFYLMPKSSFQTLFKMVKPPFSPCGVNVVALTYNLNEIKLDELFLMGIPLPCELDNAIPKRKIEYLLGRYCAQVALEQMGCSTEVGRNSDKSPKWPNSILGSITHSGSFCMSAVSSCLDYQGIGIDTETITPSLEIKSIYENFVSKDELELKPKNEFCIETWLYLVFSAKESLYKCLYPKVKLFFDFFDVQIVDVLQKNNISGSLTIRLKKKLGPFSENLLLTSNYSINFPYIHTYVLL